MKKSITTIKFGLWSALLLASGAVLVASSAYLFLSPELPSVDSLRDIRLQTPLRIYSSDNLLIAEFGEKRRTPLNYDQIPKDLINAFLAAEDDGFYTHNGVDVNGLLRATVQLITSGRIQSGGSTITMQVAKNFFLSHERVFSRKFNEILLALEIERNLSKEDILELYLNKIYLGNRAYGIEAAAQVYYGKSINNLSLAQMAMIAGLPKAPSRYNPLANPERSLERRDWILRRMLTLNMITESEYQTAVNTPVSAVFHGLPIELEAPYVAEMVRQEAIERFGTAAYTDGYRIYTTIDSKQQQAANDAIDRGLQAYDERHGYRGAERNLGPDPSQWTKALKEIDPIGHLYPAVVSDVSDESATLLLKDGSSVQLMMEQMKWAKPYINVNRQGPEPKLAREVVKVGDLIRVRKIGENFRLSQEPDVEAAMVAMQPNDGAITAIVGGFNFYGSNYNRATQANRQIGSAFKPFVYGAALDKGLTAATIINDAPLVFADNQLESYWRPQNDNQKFYGPTRLRTGLYRSRNLVSIRVLQQIGVRYAIKVISKLGLPKEKLPANLSLALGSAAMTPLELASGYTTLANGGFKVKPYLIDRITQLDEEIYKADPVVACLECEKETPAAIGQAETFALADKMDQNFAAISTPPAPTTNAAPRVMDARVNFILNDIMKDIIQKGTGRRALVLKRTDLAGKTGTTNDQRDVWFSGFNPDVQATVWMGFDQPSPLGRWEYGANAALPIWIDFMKVALDGKPEKHLPQPDGLVSIKINPKTGLQAHSNAKDAIFEIFRTENVPKAAPTVDHIPVNEMEEAISNDIF